MEAITTTLSTTLVNFALAAITLVGAYAVFYIQKAATKVKTQTQQIEHEASRNLLIDALEDVENLALVTVGAIEQTTAAALREAVKAGTADREKLLALGKEAFNEVKAAVTPEAQKAITENLGSFDAYLTNLIEDAVRRVKSENGVLTIPSELLAVSE